MIFKVEIDKQRQRRENMPILVRKPTGKRPLARTRHQEQDFIKTGFDEMGWEGVD